MAEDNKDNMSIETGGSRARRPEPLGNRHYLSELEKKEILDEFNRMASEINDRRRAEKRIWGTVPAAKEHPINASTPVIPTEAPPAQVARPQATKTPEAPQMKGSPGVPELAK